MKLRYYKMIWLLMTNSFFRSCLLQTIIYATENQNKFRGRGACDVLAFEKFFYNRVVGGKE